MKRVTVRNLAFMLILMVLVLGLFGCGKKEEPAEEPEETKTEEAGESQIANPWTDWTTPEEAEEAVGFEFGMPEEPSPGIKAESYRTMNGELIEVNFTDGEHEVTVRKVSSQEETDISGDYNTYTKEETFDVEGGKITYYTNDTDNSVKILAFADGFAWSILAPNGFPGDAAGDFLSYI